MQIDMYTALLGYILSTSLAIICTILVFGVKKGNKVTDLLVFMYSFLLTGAILMLFRDRIPNIYSVNIGNSLILSSIIFLFAAISRILGKKYNYTLLILSIIIGNAAILYYSVFDFNLQIRIVIFGSIQVLIHLLLILYIAKRSVRPEKGSALLLGYAALSILINATRIIAAILVSDHSLGFMRLQYDPGFVILGGINNVILLAALLSMINNINFAVIEKSSREAKFFAGIYDISPIPILVLDGYDRIMNVNRSLCELTMQECGTLTGSSWIEVFVPETLKQHIKESIHSTGGKSGRVYHNTRILMYDGRSIRVEMMIERHFDDFGILDYYFVFLHDLTAIQNAQKQIEKAEKQKQAILSNIPGFTYRCLFDRDWTMLELSDGFAELTGYPVNDLIYNKRMSFNDLILEDFREEVWNNWNYCIKKNIPYIGEYKIRLLDGGSCWVWEHGRLTEDTESGIKIIEGFITDVTRRKELEDDNRRMEAYLREQQKMEAIGTLASGVAHEINNPINGIMNYAQLINETSGNEDEIFEYSREIINESERVSKIVRSLLQFSGKQDMGPKITDIEETFMHTIDLFVTMAKSNEIDVKYSIGSNLPPIMCDCPRMQQVLMSLLQNSMDSLNEKYKAGNADKIIEIEVNTFEDDDGSWMRITVSDNGKGIPEHIQPYIFEPFFTTKDRSMHSGLGLSISYGIVKDHGGRLTFETRENLGTKFFIDMPVPYTE
ncbi:MAG TPA: PAS domain S-box protein [Clostridia bacterium]|nr:PAS domain S-box protein [Clostridia bacterium]